MKYLNKIGLNSKKAFLKRKTISHEKIKKVLNNYNRLLAQNKKLIIKENFKDIEIKLIIAEA